ncbi:MAG: putative 3-oxoacyl-[acyl-carrier-protein] reductase [Panacagrimonas sp.]|jgi:3-oxoacyl-[acyl-carrier protein] reductase|nr:SDR family NAD(P)-dependent oxidoreductase [Panacagrimonas sp.]MCC2656463.1 putative 3-oxoacyl-[acyl-carrier-protein] reductase [Panacagrimonas sp.]
MRKLEGRVALVTGAGRGIGLATAHKLAAEGANVVLNDLDEATVRDAVRSLLDAGAEAGSVLGVAGSVTDPDFSTRFVDAAIARFGTVDILVNNAGYVWNTAIGRMSDEQWDAMQDVHLKAAFRLLRTLAPHFKAWANDGRPQRKVVSVSSIAASRGLAGCVAYAAAKAGIIGLTRSLAREWGAIGVNVNCVCFGYIDTRLIQEIKPDGETSVDIAGRQFRVGLPKEMIDDIRVRVPLRRPGKAEEAAGAILLLCLPEADYISGQAIEVDGGGV